MGVFLCVGDQIYNMDRNKAIPYEKFGSFESITEYLKTHDTLLVFLGEGTHKIKKKAEQSACSDVIKKIS